MTCSCDIKLVRSYETRVINLARDLRYQFPLLSDNDALQRANEICQSAEEVDAMWIDIIIEEDDAQ